MDEIKSLEEIIAFLNKQANLRSPENDEGGLLKYIADLLSEDGAKLNSGDDI